METFMDPIKTMSFLRWSQKIGQLFKVYSTI
jgi:hypothetical protein